MRNSDVMDVDGLKEKMNLFYSEQQSMTPKESSRDTKSTRIFTSGKKYSDSSVKK